MKLSKIIPFLSVLMVLFLSSCYKFNHNYMMKGKWYVNAFEINGGNDNLMEGVLPHFVDGDGQYIVYLTDNGILRGEYYVSDSLYYFRTGTWNMPHKDSVYFDFDIFVDGTYYIESVDSKLFTLTTDANNIEFFNIGEVAAVMRISRGEYIDPALSTP